MADLNRVFTIRYTLNEEASAKGSCYTKPAVHPLSQQCRQHTTNRSLGAKHIPGKAADRLAILLQDISAISTTTCLKHRWSCIIKPCKTRLNIRKVTRRHSGIPEEEFTFGKGWSYGAELFVNKVRGRFTGWIGYTLSWTYGANFLFSTKAINMCRNLTVRHDMSVVGTYELNKKWKLSSVFRLSEPAMRPPYPKDFTSLMVS